MERQEHDDTEPQDPESQDPERHNNDDDDEGEPDQDAPPEGIDEQGSDASMDPDVLERIRADRDDAESVNDDDEADDSA